jgi:long-chain acyl-CoA synthetase
VIHAHPDVADCAVFGVPDDEWGEAVHAVVELAADAALDAGGLRTHCLASLANYKVPRSVDFSTALPREPSGKIYKRKLRDPFWTGRPR